MFALCQNQWSTFGFGVARVTSRDEGRACGRVFCLTMCLPPVSQPGLLQTH
ncbi:hypothetical protein E2C01_080386 [Portunus trituberculatus]|uniref:Uncharacterized protein n=1 Tax=Portunus trituberculatus TaxID=210409 RepID=A0A5B7IT43_PORTR|nr:hypothetical protein [Portunus trituberculatus]